jgi:hypothetical protein
MILYDTKLWDAILDAESDLAAVNHYDEITQQEIVLPPKNIETHASAYNYCYGALDLSMLVEDLIEELKLIKLYIKTAPVFNEQHPDFDLAFLLEFSYKNWIIRINTLGELIFHFAIHIYQIKMPRSQTELMEAIFNTDEVQKNKQLKFALLNIVDFLKMERLHKANGKTIRKNRNKIVHKGEFTHPKMTDLTWLLFEYEGGKVGYDETDKLIDKNVATIEIEREITEFTIKFMEKANVLFVLLEKEFKKRFKYLMIDCDKR